jgi:hypothetical protein
LARLGITGHRDLTPKTADLTYRAIQRALSAYRARELIGISCLAAGADSIFAQAVLDLGGRLEVVLPATDYRERTIEPSHVARFDELLRRAIHVRTMPYAESGRDAYEAANRHLVSSCERLFAVWDGQPAGGRGGTADVVRYANTRGVPVEIVWPTGAERG